MPEKSFAIQKGFVIWQIGFYRLYCTVEEFCGPQGFWGSGEKGYLFSGSRGALLIILGELGSKHILLGI